MGEAQDGAKGRSVMQVFAVVAAADAEREEGSEGPFLWGLRVLSRLGPRYGGHGFGIIWRWPWPRPHMAVAVASAPRMAAELLQPPPCFGHSALVVAAPHSGTSPPPLT